MTPSSRVLIGYTIQVKLKLENNYVTIIIHTHCTFNYHIIQYTCTYFFKLFKLSIAEFVQSVCVSFLHSAQSHITDTVTHFTHIQERRA